MWFFLFLLEVTGQNSCPQKMHLFSTALQDDRQSFCLAQPSGLCTQFSQTNKVLLPPKYTSAHPWYLENSSQRVKFDETVLQFDFHPHKFLTNNPLKPCPVWHSSSCSGKEQARTVPSWYPNFWVLWLCRSKEAFANTPITALPPLSIELPDHHFFSKAQPAASGLSGDGQVTGGAQREAGRQLQGSSSGKKLKYTPERMFAATLVH